MAEKLSIFKCEVCGNIVELLHPGGGTLVCCNQPMSLLPEKATEEGNEKHLPVIEKMDDGTLVKVGSVEHPMLDKHFIQWIDIVTEKCVLRKFLQPGEKPEMKSCCKCKVIKAREYCNLHGLWSSKQ